MPDTSTGQTDRTDSAAEHSNGELPPVPGHGLERRIAEVGSGLSGSLSRVLDAIPGEPASVALLSRTLGIDKVLASRVLKAAKNSDAMATVYLAPGPEPLRRLLKAASRKGVQQPLIVEAHQSIDAFEQLIRVELGDRSALDAIISAWLPEAREEFELRRKQSAFKAMSQLKGAMSRFQLATAMLHPSEDGQHLDIVWIQGSLGLRRLRPGVTVKFASRRIVRDESPRLPMTLDQIPVEGIDGLRLDAFSSGQPAPLHVRHAGESVIYTLGDSGFGPQSDVDIVIAEVNFAEIDRYVPAHLHRKGHVFTEVATPTKELQFDAIVHKDVYPERDPELIMYDTVLDGVADVNDPARDIDRLDLSESIQSLGRGAAKFRAAAVPSYVDLLRYVCEKLQWDDQEFRCHRCSIDYPIYGSQVTMAFDPPAPGK